VREGTGRPLWLSPQLPLAAPPPQLQELRCPWGAQKGSGASASGSPPQLPQAACWPLLPPQRPHPHPAPEMPSPRRLQPLELAPPHAQVSESPWGTPQGAEQAP